MYRVYQVKNGDTISKIAESLNISSQELINLNSLNNEVTPGQLIVVPNQNTIFESYTVVKGDNLYDIARRYNISVEDLISLNGIDSDDYIYPGESILVPKNDIDVYIIATKADKISKNQIFTNKRNIQNILGVSENNIIVFSSINKTGVNIVEGVLNSNL